MVMRMDGEKYSRTQKLLSTQKMDQRAKNMHHSVAIPPKPTSCLGIPPPHLIESPLHFAIGLWASPWTAILHYTYL